MTDSCAVYVSSETVDDIVEAVAAVVDRDCLTAKHEGEQLGSLEYVKDQVAIIVNRMAGTQEGDEFSQVVASTHSFAKSLSSTNKGNQDDLLEALLKTKQVFGVIAEPSFDEAAEEIIFAIAEAGKGIIFTGNAFLNSKAGLILDIEGNSDEGL